MLVLYWKVQLYQNECLSIPDWPWIPTLEDHGGLQHAWEKKYSKILSPCLFLQTFTTPPCLWQPSFFVVYNMVSTEVLAVFENTSDQLLELFENFCDLFRNATLHSQAVQFPCSASSNNYARQVQRRYWDILCTAEKNIIRLKCQVFWCQKWDIFQFAHNCAGKLLYHWLKIETAHDGVRPNVREDLKMVVTKGKQISSDRLEEEEGVLGLNLDLGERH